ncbi:MAG TPA: phosphate regulon sensor histidine kinase PhoR [Rhizobium sp.]|nr:phosphate regulon sensor histidine kinase PhoR [Rhizobium sp.]
MSRFRAGWSFLAAAALVAVAAYFAGAQPLFSFALWFLALLVVLVRESAPSRMQEEPAERMEAVEATLSQVESMLGALDLPVVVIDGEATVLAQNKAAEKAFGPLLSGLHISTRWRSPGILDMIRETIETGEPNQIEHSERLPSERVYVVRSAQVEKLAGTLPRLFLVSFRDISELRRLDRMRSDFVANASHELRTPLASLRGFIETLQGPARGDPKAQERFLAIMLDQATRMSRLVDDLLSLSRLELKAHIAPDQTVDLVPVLGHVRDSLAPLAADLGVDIRLHLPEGKVEVLGDRDELVQVFENLVENGCKYGQEGKVVDVYLRHGGGTPVEVSVVDHGPGIPAEHVPRLTERFYRVSVADSRSKKGTGLGLAIVKHILTRHRARLIVRSEIDKGTDFTVRF